MVQKVFGLIYDCGDGSSLMKWFRDEELAHRLTSEDEYCEEYGQNEGGFAEELEFPDSLDLESCGFQFTHDDFDDLEDLDD